MAQRGLQQDFGDLQQRLEHLITYSSQLAFVSGEGMGAQFSFVEGFLANQNELANVCYIKASPRLSAADYRSRLTRQLTGHQLMDTSQPLKDVLPRRLPEESQFILIVVTQAEQLPSDLLKELWDLVLQNRFARHRHHLNVLLFGEKEWAEQTKTWLHGNSNDKPVLLSTQSLTKQESSTDLERLIADKREAFAERMKARAETSSRSLLSRWWFKALAALMLLTLVTALMLVSYFDLSQQELQEFSEFLFQADIEAAESVSEMASEAEPMELMAAEPAAAEDASEASDSRQLDSEPAAIAVDDTALAKPALVEQQPVSQSNARVLNWQAAIQRSRESAESEESALSRQAADAGAVVEVDGSAQAKLAADNSNTSNETLNDATVAEVELSPYPQQQAAQAVGFEREVSDAESISDAPIDDVDDYPVEDITSLDQLGERAQTDNAPGADWDSAMLMSLPASDRLLQLAAMSSPSVLASYLEDNQLTDSVWLYRTERFGGNWYVVLHNQRYATSAAARQALASIAVPEGAQPFIKTAGQIQQELIRP